MAWSDKNSKQPASSQAPAVVLSGSSHGPPGVLLTSSRCPAKFGTLQINSLELMPSKHSPSVIGVLWGFWCEDKLTFQIEFMSAAQAVLATRGINTAVRTGRAMGHTVCLRASEIWRSWNFSRSIHFMRYNLLTCPGVQTNRESINSAMSSIRFIFSPSRWAMNEDHEREPWTRAMNKSHEQEP